MRMRLFILVLLFGSFLNCGTIETQEMKNVPLRLTESEKAKMLKDLSTIYENLSHINKELDSASSEIELKQIGEEIYKFRKEYYQSVVATEVELSQLDEEIIEKRSEIYNILESLREKKYKLETRLEEIESILKNSIKIEAVSVFDEKIKKMSLIASESPENPISKKANIAVIFLQENREKLVKYIAEKRILDEENAKIQNEINFQAKAEEIHSRHPKWSKKDCLKIVHGDIWIGMEIDMLIERRGQPFSANPSNYGKGIKWQWCWPNYTPSCFYDTNNDGKIDAYN